MITKTIRSRSRCEVGGKVEGCTVLEKSIIIAPDLIERRLGVYDYIVEFEAPLVVAAKLKAKPKAKGRRKTAPATEPASFSPSTAYEMPA
jgi:hypothetical protein